MASLPAGIIRALLTSTVTFSPGKWPPMPGFAPCPILISMKRLLSRYALCTPKRPDATCTTAQSPNSFKPGCMPPSPVLKSVPSSRAASASVFCALKEIEPNDIAENIIGVSKRICGGMTVFIAPFSSNSILSGFLPK